MSIDISFIEKFFNDYVSVFEKKSYVFDDVANIYKSNLDCFSLNFAFINRKNVHDATLFIKNNFNYKGIIVSEDQLVQKELVSIYGEKINYLGKLPLMEKIEKPEHYQSPFYDNVKIVKIGRDKISLLDFFEIFSNSKAVKKEYLESSMFVNGVPSNHHIFIAYLNEEPCGYFYAISNEKNAFTVDAYVKENYRNFGILNKLSKKAREVALQKEIYNLYTIPTSEFSMKTISAEGYIFKNFFHFWAVSNWYNCNKVGVINGF